MPSLPLIAFDLQGVPRFVDAVGHGADRTLLIEIDGEHQPWVWQEKDLLTLAADCEMRAEAVGNSPLSAYTRGNAGKSLNNLGVLLLSIDRASDAVPAFGSALEQWGQDSVGDLFFQLQHAVTIYNVCMAASSLGSTDGIPAMVAEARGHLDRVTERNESYALVLNALSAFD